MSSLRVYLAIFVAATVALVGGAVLIERTTIDRLLRNDAVSTGRTWTEYLADNLADLEAIAAGRKPTPQSMAFLQQAQAVGQVFRYKIYDGAGRMVLVSDDLPIGNAEAEGLLEHNSEAAEAIEARRPLIEAKEGTPPARPPFFSEAYVPVIVDDKVVAVVETYIDQTAKRAEFLSTFILAATALSLLITVAFAAPAAGWYFRKREQQRSDARIHFLANFDALTGLANRARLSEGLNRALAERAVRPSPLAVYCVDLDRFKDINDLLGIDGGDMIIKVVADRLKALAAPGDIVARLGGDEFAIVRMHPGDADARAVFAGQVVEQLAASVWTGRHESRPSASVGIAIAPDHGNEAGRLIKSAELALTKSKAAGPARTSVFSADLDDELHARLKLERTIVDAVENDGFTLHFQPLLGAGEERLTGFEALLRLPTDIGGFIPPAVFIPIAEKMGLIDRIGAWVLEQACTTAAAWPNHLTVAVNLSPIQFVGGDVVRDVERALGKSQLDPRRLELEITESLLMGDTESVLGDLRRLKALGAAIVMDDFGTGYSSLSYLWRFPFDKIKIDQSFLRAFDQDDATAEKIIGTIVALGRALRMRVNAEGIETARHAAFIRTIDCDEMQGFYFGRPEPSASIGAIILADFARHSMGARSDREAQHARA